MEEDTEQTCKNRKASHIEDSDANSSAIVSRYGRTHKPKHISGDFLETNKRFSSVLAKRSTGSRSPEGDLDESAFADDTINESAPVEDNVGNIGGPMLEDTANEGFMMNEEMGDDVGMGEDIPEYLPGDLMWGRVGNHPFWPCMIMVDHDAGSYYKTNGLGRLQYHVIFYGDRGRRSWVGSGAILRFLGKDEMEMQAAGITPEVRRKDPKWYSGFFVKDQVRPRWLAAVQEAEDAMPMTRDERTDAFFQSLPPKSPKKSASAPKKPDPPVMPPEIQENLDEIVSSEPAPSGPDEKPGSDAEPPSKTPVKEPALSSSSPPPVKRGRGRPKKDADAADTPKENKEKETKESKESKSQTPAAATTASRKRKLVHDEDESEKKKPSIVSVKEEPKENAASEGAKKRRRSKPKKIDDRDFEVYREKQMDRFMEDHPDLSPDEIEKFMRKSWASMSEAQKSKYQSRLAKSAPQSSESEVSAGGDSSGDDRGAEDDGEQDSAKDNGDQSNSAPVSKRKTNIFRGFRFERVCQVCELPSNTVKCRGCSSVFHRDCVYNEANDSSDDSDAKSKKRRRSRKAEPPKPPPKPKKIKWTAKDIYMSVVHDSDSDYDQDEVTPISEDSADVLACILGDVSAPPEASIVVDVSSDEDTPEDDEEGGPGGVLADLANRAKAAAPEDFRCMDCVVGRVPLCFSCGKATDPSGEDSNRYRCGTGYCGKHYHAECLKMWPQSSYTISSGAVQSMICPQHVCHTCASHDLRETKRKALNERLVRCVRCPTAYHYGNYCLPAGSEVLTSTQIICPRHYKASKKTRHINAAWCFICSMGGTLLCCDLCPAAFHADCLQISPPQGSYICEDCESGRFALYHEVLWVKLGTYRWWPAFTLFPNEIPDNIKNIEHAKGEFAVRFLGTNDYFWINRGRCFLYQEGDSESRKISKSQFDEVFKKALVEAQELHKQQNALKATRDAEARPNLIKPPSYVKIKTNKPVGNVKMFEPDKSNTSACECNPDSEHPCSPESDCLNRILLVECNPAICAAGSRCENQCFDKRLYPPLQPWLTEGRGWGLRTLADIKKGAFVIEYVGEVIDDEEFKMRMARKHKEKDENYYFLTIDSNRMIDAGPKGNMARFMNHSCQPNCETQKWTVAGNTRVGLFALCDIPAESELTFNYNLESQGFDKKQCKCGAKDCVGLIGAKKTKPAPPPVETTSTKKKGRKSRPIETCFTCGSDGEKMVTCDNKTCGKTYHLGCADLKVTPSGKWLCGRHKCQTCGKRTQQNCSLCVAAFCLQHTDGNLLTHDVHGLVCKTHKENPVRPTLTAEGERSGSPNLAKQAREEEKRRCDELRKQKEGERRKKEEEERASRRSRRERIASVKGKRHRRKNGQDNKDAPSETPSEAPSEASSEDLAAVLTNTEDISEDEKLDKKDVKNESEIKTEDLDDTKNDENSHQGKEKIGEDREKSEEVKEEIARVENAKVESEPFRSETEIKAEKDGEDAKRGESQSFKNDLPSDSVQSNVEDNTVKNESAKADSVPGETNPTSTPTFVKKSEIPVVGSSKRKFRGKDPTRGTATINRLSLTRKDAVVKGGPFDKSRLSTELEDLAKSFGTHESPATSKKAKEPEDLPTPKLVKPKRPKADSSRLNLELDDVVESFVSDLQDSKTPKKSRFTDEDSPVSARESAMTTPVAARMKTMETPSILGRAKSPPGRKTPCTPISLNGGSPDEQLSASKLLAMQRAKGLKVMPPNRHLSNAREKARGGAPADKFAGKVQKPNKGLKILKGQRPEPLSPTSTDSDAMSPPPTAPKKGLRLGLSKVASKSSVAESVRDVPQLAEVAESQSAEPERLKSPVQNGSAKKKTSSSKKSVKDLGVCSLWNQDILNILQ